MDSTILDQLEATYEQELSLARGDLRASEQQIQDLMKSLGAGLLQRLVDRGPNGYQGSAIPCACGQTMRFVGHRPRSIHTALGYITIQRAYYHCPACHQSQVPYDRASGLGPEQLSPALAQACCLLTVDDSFAETASKIQRLFGETVGDVTVERVVQHVGRVRVQQQEAQLQRFQDQREIPTPQACPQRLYVTADGTTAHERGRWHEAKVGCLCSGTDRRRRCWRSSRKTVLATAKASVRPSTV